MRKWNRIEIYSNSPAKWNKSYWWGDASYLRQGITSTWRFFLNRLIMLYKFKSNYLSCHFVLILNTTVNILLCSLCYLSVSPIQIQILRSFLTFCHLPFLQSLFRLLFPLLDSSCRPTARLYKHSPSFSPFHRYLTWSADAVLCHKMFLSISNRSFTSSFSTAYFNDILIAHRISFISIASTVRFFSFKRYFCTPVRVFRIRIWDIPLC